MTDGVEVSKDQPRTIRLRHYTRISTLARIATDGMLVARDQNKVFVERADRRPLGPREAEEVYLLKRGKGSAYIEFDAESDELLEQTNSLTGETEYFLEGDVDLTDRQPHAFENR
jgi:HYD1 signature containing ADP-ribosyltransferase